LHDNYKNCVVQIGKNTIYQQKFRPSKQFQKHLCDATRI